MLPCSNILNADTYLAPGSVQGNEGDVVQVPIYFETNESIVGADIILQFDETILQLGEILPGSSITDHQIYDDQTDDGELKITILSMTNDVLIDGNLSLLSFLLLQNIDEESHLIKTDLDESMFIAASTLPFEITPILPISELNLSFPLEQNDQAFAKDRGILFSVDSDGSLPSYSWNMGDKSSVIEGNTSVFHSYNTPGVYLVTVHAKNQFGSFEKSFEITVDEPFWEFDAQDIGNGWKSFDWFGEYFPVSDTDWLYHINLGWLYRAGENIDSTWLWSENWGWGWTGKDAFPYFYLSSDDWIYYFNGTSDPIWYYDYGLSRWIEIDRDNRLQAEFSPENNQAGVVMGPEFFYLGDSVTFVAKPKAGYLFAGWSGSYTGGVNPLIIHKPSSNISLQGKFISIQELINEGSSSLSLDHLDSSTQQKALAEILLKGTSQYIDSGNAPEFELDSNTNEQIASSTSLVFPNETMGEQVGIFSENSSNITHDFLPLSTQIKQVEFLENNSKSLATVESNGTAIYNSIDCTILKINLLKDLQEKRWLAQDKAGNVWLIQSEINGINSQTSPSILLPRVPQKGIASWPKNYSVPTDFSILVDYPFTFRPLNSKIAEDCLNLRLHRSNMKEQLEVYSKAKGLVKISR
jgi:PKD repeat protein